MRMARRICLAQPASSALAGGHHNGRTHCARQQRRCHGRPSTHLSIWHCSAPRWRECRKGGPYPRLRREAVATCRSQQVPSFCNMACRLGSASRCAACSTEKVHRGRGREPLSKAAIQDLYAVIGRLLQAAGTSSPQAVPAPATGGDCSCAAPDRRFSQLSGALAGAPLPALCGVWPRALGQPSQATAPPPHASASARQVLPPGASQPCCPAVDIDINIALGHSLSWRPVTRPAPGLGAT